ncbi:MAG: GNAT family N-acetyltransferase [Mycobacteriales bacterium]
MATTTSPSVRALLADGQVAAIREIVPDDREALRDLHARMSERSLFLRFFSLGTHGPDQFAARITTPAPGTRTALGAFAGGRIIGVASYETLLEPETAEVALAVADDMHGHGVGTLLLEHLGSRARQAGVLRFVAEVMPENRPMLRVFADSGLRAVTRQGGGAIELEILLNADDSYLDAVAGREEAADVASLRALLAPASVAVVGAGRNPGGIGRAVLDNLLAAGFPGPVYPVNPAAAGGGGTVAGRPAYGSVADLPEAVDLAVIAVPAAAVPKVAAGCGERGIRHLVVLTAGLTGTPLEEELRATVRHHGMRMVGPNCLGVACGPLNATFARTLPASGHVLVVSQSGGVAIALSEQMGRLGVGMSAFVSTGDKYDVSGNDLLYWAGSDPATEAVVLYLESFGNPRKFARLARHVSSVLPVLAVKAGTSDVARRAAASHTAASATPAAVRDALFRQAGVVAVDGLAELLGALAVLTHQPLPAGDRIAIVSNAGGIGVLAADACAAYGLTMTALDPATTATLAGLLPATASLANPVDTTAVVSDEAFAECLAAVTGDPNVDAVLAVCAPTAVNDPLDALARLVPNGTTLVAVGAAQAESIRAMTREAGPPVPVFADAGQAVAALAAAVRYGQWRARPAGNLPDLPGFDVAAARGVAAKHVAAAVTGAGGGWLDPVTAAELLATTGIDTGRAVVAPGVEEAEAARRRFGVPVALKAVAPGLVHRTDKGGVELGIADTSGLAAAYARLADRFGAELSGVLVQPMAEPGVEVLVGVVSDPMFGPLVVFGAGGVQSDLWNDRAARLVPLTGADATEMIDSVRVATLLRGFRGTPPADIPAVRDLLLRIARLAELVPEIAELDLNPVLVHPHGYTMVDAKIRLTPTTPTDPYLRHLR